MIHYLKTQNKIASLAILVILMLCLMAGRPVVVATASDSIDTSVFVTAAHSFAEEAEAAGNHHMTQEPVITIVSRQTDSESALGV